MKRNFKHLTFDDRLEIQKSLFMNHSISKIASNLGKHLSSVIREIKSHSHFKYNNSNISYTSIGEHLVNYLLNHLKFVMDVFLTENVDIINLFTLLKLQMLTTLNLLVTQERALTLIPNYLITLAE